MSPHDKANTLHQVLQNPLQPLEAVLLNSGLNQQPMTRALGWFSSAACVCLFILFLISSASWD